MTELQKQKDENEVNGFTKLISSLLFELPAQHRRHFMCKTYGDLINMNEY